MKGYCKFCGSYKEVDKFNLCDKCSEVPDNKYDRDAFIDALKDDGYFYDEASYIADRWENEMDDDD